MKNDNNKIVYKCMYCEKTLDRYKVEYCCNGFQCGCRGLPIEPPLCDECWEKFMLGKN